MYCFNVRFKRMSVYLIMLCGLFLLGGCAAEEPQKDVPPSEPETVQTAPDAAPASPADSAPNTTPKPAPPEEEQPRSGPVFGELITKPDAIRYYLHGGCVTVSDQDEIDIMFAEIQNGLQTVRGQYGLYYEEDEMQTTLDTGEVIGLVYDEPLWIAWELEGLGLPAEYKFNELWLILDDGQGVGRRGMLFFDRRNTPLGDFTLSDSLETQLNALRGDLPSETATPGLASEPD